jgi:uncharacterized protein (TIGR00730 family)
MSKISRVCVFCGASGQGDKKYQEQAYAVGAALAQAGLAVVYGGSDTGLMGAVANGALEAKGKVIGILPEDLKTQQGWHQGLTETHITKNFFERKKLMAKLSQAFIVLPGGIGTADELFEFMTYTQLEYHDHPILIFNQDNFYDKLIEFLRHVADEKFCSHDDVNNLRVASTVEELIAALHND